MVEKHHNPEDLMTPGEVAKVFKVNPKTITRWARAGKLSSFRTLGGHRRFLRAEVLKLLVASAERPDPQS